MEDQFNGKGRKDSPYDKQLFGYDGNDKDYRLETDIILQKVKEIKNL